MENIDLLIHIHALGKLIDKRFKIFSIDWCLDYKNISFYEHCVDFDGPEYLTDVIYNKDDVIEELISLIYD